MFMFNGIIYWIFLVNLLIDHIAVFLRILILNILSFLWIIVWLFVRYSQIYIDISICYLYFCKINKKIEHNKEAHFLFETILK